MGADWGKTVKIGGKTYDDAMIKAAKYGAKGKHDHILSTADVKLIFKALAPSGKSGTSTYAKTEKATAAYIRKKYKFTAASKKLLASLIATRGVAQAKRTKAKKKAMKAK